MQKSKITKTAERQEIQKQIWFFQVFRFLGFAKPNKVRLRRGFTIAELMIATIVLGVLISAAAGVYTNFYNSVRNLKAANLVYEEARFTMERIVKEVRNGTIDYEEYYNQETNFLGDPATQTNDTYGDNYCEYSQQFYTSGPDGEFGTYDDESIGKRKDGASSPLSSPIQNNLYLINTQGNKRAFIKRLETAEGLGKVGMLKLYGEDYGMDHIKSEDGGISCIRDSGEKDGLIDTWFCERGYNCDSKQLSTSDPLAGINCDSTGHLISDNPSDIDSSSFIDITPDSLDIVDLKFFLTPSDDPHKAYNVPEAQIQPHVTIKLTARANPNIAKDYKGETPKITLESTVSARAYTQIITECNLQECIDGVPKDCPKTFTDTSSNIYIAEVTCAQSVWPVCTKTVYEEAFLSNGLGLDTEFAALFPTQFGAAGGYTYYEDKNEIGSCETEFSDTQDIADCKERRCTDEFDNDGNGLIDADDHSCAEDLCNNGILNPDVGEECIDVGGNCYMRPRETKETSCFDGYDNDCSYNKALTAEENINLGLGADEYDSNCIQKICSNADHDNSKFGDKLYATPNYLVGKTEQAGDWDEQCINIGGLCALAKSQVLTPASVTIYQDIQNEETGDYCFDGLDNDCDGNADELDDGCVDAICKNGAYDCDLVNSTYTPSDYLRGYDDSDCALLSNDPSDNDEVCENAPDVGGLCQSIGEYASAENTPTLCTDGLDNDCDGLKDTDDIGNPSDSCCHDEDSDGFYTFITGQCEPAVGDPNTTPIIDFGERDCDDSDINIKPPPPNATPSQAVEATCDDAEYPTNYPVISLREKPIDENCSGLNEITIDGWDHNDPTCCVDIDGDGYGTEDAYLYNQNGNCSNNSGSLDGNFDCDDLKASVYPGATETCNGIDDDCDGVTDEGVGNTYYEDNDGDGYGDPAKPQVACSATGNLVSDNTDCNDGEIGINPGATEICNGIDEDCDGLGDEEAMKIDYYQDNDGDGYGNTAITQKGCPVPPAASPPAGYTSNDGDSCTGGDGNININKDQTETCNGIDDDCDGLTDENLLDTYYQDADGDGFGNPAVFQSGVCSTSGYVLDNTDCNDGNSNINPNDMEVCNDSGTADEDCDGVNGYDASEGGCLTLDNRTFYDFLGNLNYISSIDSGVTSGAAFLEIDDSGSVPLGGYVVSKKLPLSEAGCAQFSQITGLTYELTGSDPTTVLDLQFSTDAGSSWCGDDNCTGDTITYEEVKIDPGNLLSLPITLTSSSSLMWRANFVDNLIGGAPIRWSRLAITFKCVGD